MPQYYTLPTAIGEAKIANAIALGGTITISELAVGDGGGSTPVPDSDRTTLVNEVRRAPINTSVVDPDNPNWIVVEQVLPPDIGGWTIREIGLFDSDGDLIAYGNYPETYKPVLSEGSGRTQTIRFVMQVSDTASVTLKVDPSVVLATREYVETQRAEHEASRSHPAATTTALGFVEKATTTEAKAGVADKFPDSAGVLATIQQFGIGRTTQADYSGHLDNLITSGFYGIYASTLAGGAPGNFDGTETGVVEVVVRDHNFVMQRLTITRGVDAGRVWVRILDTGEWQLWNEIYSSKSLSPATETSVGLVEKATLTEAKNGTPDKFPDAASMKAAIADSRSGDQFATYDANRTYTTGEIVRGSDGTFYEFYDRDQVGTVKGVAPTDPLNRPHVWMEWDGVRPGITIEWRSETLPEGYIENDGSAISRADYRRVFAAYGTTYGAGDGATTFNLPEDRGEFKRGWDHGRGVDTDRVALADHQWHAVEYHTHGMPTGQGVQSSTGFWGLDDSYWTEYANLNVALSANNEPAISNDRGNSRYDKIGGNWAAETRSRNNAVIWLTKI